jgi:hypothetical protein
MVTSTLALVLVLVVMVGLFFGLLLLSSMTYSGARSVPRHLKEARFAHSANHLVAEVREAVKHCAIPSAKQKVLKQQAREIADNITGALWKLHHLRKIRQLAAGMGGTWGGSVKTGSYAAHIISETTEMERQLLQEIDRSLEVLFSVPISLMKVGLAQGERTADRILAELRETNERMRDIAATYDDMKARSEEPFAAGATDMPGADGVKSKASAKASTSARF